MLEQCGPPNLKAVVAVTLGVLHISVRDGVDGRTHIGVKVPPLIRSMPGPSNLPASPPERFHGVPFLILPRARRNKPPIRPHANRSPLIVSWTIKVPPFECVRADIRSWNW